MVTILCVDDEELILRGYQRFLPREGHEVLTAGDGREALQVLAATPASIDGVITDCTMPRMSGLDLTRSIRAGEAGDQYKTLPVVIISGGSVTNKKDALTAGATAFLEKPLSPDQILNAARTYFVEKKA